MRGWCFGIWFFKVAKQQGGVGGRKKGEEGAGGGKEGEREGR